MKQYNSPKVEVSVVQVETGFQTSVPKDTFKTILGSTGNPEEL